MIDLKDYTREDLLEIIDAISRKSFVYMSHLTKIKDVAKENEDDQVVDQLTFCMNMANDIISPAHKLLLLSMPGEQEVIKALMEANAKGIKISMQEAIDKDLLCTTDVKPESSGSMVFKEHHDEN